MPVAPAPFAVQAKNFFGLKPGQKAVGAGEHGVPSFMDELKALDANDKAEFTDMLNAAGYPVKAKDEPATA